MKVTFALLLLSAFAFSCKEKTNADILKKNHQVIELLNVEDFAKHIKNKNVQIIDVRTEKEFSQGYIEKAKNFDINSGKFNELVLTLDKNKAVYVYCSSGKRSKKASLELQKLGFNKIYDLKGGFLSWTEN